MVDGRDSAWGDVSDPHPKKSGKKRALTRSLMGANEGPEGHPQYANSWAPLTRKRHIPPHSAQPQRTNYWAPRTRKRHQQEHRPQRPTERSDPTQHAKGRAGDCPGPRKGTATRRNVTHGGGGGGAQNQGESGPLESAHRWEWGVFLWRLLASENGARRFGRSPRPRAPRCSEGGRGVPEDDGVGSKAQPPSVRGAHAAAPPVCPTAASGGPSRHEVRRRRDVPGKTSIGLQVLNETSSEVTVLFRFGSRGPIDAQPYHLGGVPCPPAS